MYYENYEKLRNEKKVNDSMVAKATGIDRTTFSHWKKGLYTPKKDKLLKIAQYFGVQLDTLYAEKREIKKNFFQKLFSK